MRRRSLARRPSPSLVISIVALVVALGGTSYAAFSLPKNSVGTKQLKNKAVTNSKIKNGAVTASKINTSGLTVPNSNHANSAIKASNAANAANLGGSPASAYVTSPVGAAQLGPLPAVRVTNSGDEAVSNAGFTLITFNTSQYDNAGMHSNTTNSSRLTAPISGVYEITGQVAWNSNATGSRELIITKNEGPFVARSTVPVTSTVAIDQQISTQVNLSAGDYVELAARQDTGGSLNVLAEDNDPMFAMHWLGS